MMKKPSIEYFLVALIVSASTVSSMVSAQSFQLGVPDNIKIKGFARAGYQQRIGDYGESSSEDGGPAQGKLHNNFDTKLELNWKHSDLSIDTLLYAKYLSQYSDSTSQLEDELEFEADVRETYITLETDAWQYRLGKQQIAWGKGDYFRIVDVVNPLDMREGLLPYLDDYSLGRVPREMAVIEHYREHVEFQFVAAIKTERTLFAPGGGDFALNGVPESYQRADTDNLDLGVKASFFVDSTDWDLYLFKGYSPDPQFKVSRDDSSFFIEEELSARSLIATSFATPTFFCVVRGDLAYYFEEPLQLDSRTESIEKYDMLLGVDIQNNEWTFNLQTTFSQFVEAPQDYELNSTAYNASAMVQKEWTKLRLMSSLVWLYNYQDTGSHLMKYNLRYDWRSESQIELGIVVFGGSEGSLHGSYDDQDRVYINFKQSFGL